ncbi:MAG: hypothetical protein LUK37_00225 [Clostridia bacterium]|nr:hypothetical protein [Clostridia bacterium]
MKAEEINWEADVWFTERLNISSERYSRSNTIESFSFIDIHSNVNRQSLQRYLNKKSYPVVNEIYNLDQKLDLLTSHLGEFPDNLRIMSLILLTTGIKKGPLYLLRNADFYYENESSWMKVPDTTRNIPIPAVLHWLVLKYSDRNHISVV